MTGIQQLLLTNFLSGAASDQTATILVVAGGGGGGPPGSDAAVGGVVPTRSDGTNDIQGGRGCGGGAGGLILLDSEFPMDAGTEYTITVGPGGTMSVKGSDSVITGGGRTLTALGGGASGCDDSKSNLMDKGGGSGGGAWYGAPSDNQIGGCAQQTALTNDGIDTYSSTGFGNKGGDGNSGVPYGGGGGGAMEAGFGGSNSNGGNYGGIGKEVDILGSSGVYYAGGGASVNFEGLGGSLQATGTTAGNIHIDHGRKGGGGFGDNTVDNTAGTALTNGVANTGGGGGSGGLGGKGVVIIRLPNAATSTTGAPSETTVGGEIAYYFTSDGTLTI